MHLAQTPFLPASPILKHRNRIITLTLIAISTYFGFQLFDSMHSYMPWPTRIPLALRKTFMIHFGLWLATMGIRNRFRFVVAALLIPSGAGAYLLCWPVGIITAIPAAFGLGSPSKPFVVKVLTLNFLHLQMEAARLEAYEYFNQKIRPLPKLKNGKINVNANGLDDNDIDAFRHAYVSGVFTQEYGETAANILGLMNEFDLAGTFSNSIALAQGIWTFGITGSDGNTGRKQRAKRRFSN
jgi:hypothetical protein